MEGREQNPAYRPTRPSYRGETVGYAWITARWGTPKVHQCDATRRGGQGRRSAWRRPRPAVPVSRFQSVRAPGLARSVFGLRRPASGQSTRRRPPAADQKSRPTPTASLARISTQLVRGKGSADFVAQGAV